MTTAAPRAPLPRVLADPAASRSLLAVLVSGFGTSALWLVAGVWTKDLTGSDSLAALCVLALWAPTLIGPWLGAVADRGRRRIVLVSANLALAVLLLTLFAVDGRDRVWILLTVLVLYGACGVVTDAAESAYLAGAVPQDVLGDLGGLRMSVNEGMKILAPLAGAALYAAWGGPLVALLDAVTFALAAGLFATLPADRDAPAAHRERRRALDGVRELWQDAPLRRLVLAGGAAMFLSGIAAGSVFAVVETLGHAPSYTGVLYAVQGAGSVVAGLLTGALLRRLGPHRFAACGIALFALGVAARAVPLDAAALASSAAIGLGLPCPLVAALTTVQRRTPHALLGRVTAAAHTVLFTPTAVALGVGAGLVGVAPPAVLLPVVGAAGLVVAALTRGLTRGRNYMT
ncbi:MFS transporter [Streptomyces sp. SID8379]|uniref:MFS transporter n=1 Tax=unclassified Streptomyces TaxID=2593676 RepID=UPI000367F7D4|nr:MULTISPECIES: MFS transporter [unclassified Streptomyces]MYW66544.1 MFS transporter [Streptomyces sp. SID8379]